MDRENRNAHKGARASSAAVFLCAASVALSSLLTATFRLTSHGIQSALQPLAIADGGWLEVPSPSYQALPLAQANATHVVGLVVFGVLLSALLVAASSLCTLVWTRESARRAELATRAALGAAPATLLSELSRPVLRSLVLGGGAGLLLGSALNAILRTTWPGVVSGSGLQAQMLGVTGSLISMVLLTVVTLSALWLFVVRGPLADLLRAGDRATASLADTRVRELFATLQIATCTALLVVGAVLARPADNFDTSAAPTIDAAGVLWVRADTSGERIRAQRAAALHELLTDGAGAREGAAQSVASSGALLGVGLRDRLYSECDNCPRMPTTLRTMSMHSVGPHYFTLLNARLLRGRDFALTDGPDAQPVVIVNDSFVREMFGPRGSGLGRVVRLQLGLGEAHRIVGVVADETGLAPGAPPAGEPVAWFSALQHPPVNYDHIVRPASDSLTLPPGFSAGSTVAQRRAAAQEPLQHAALGIRVLTILCFLLGGYGLHATTSLLVRGRRRELGMRLALGSTPAGLMRYVSGYALRLAFVGVFTGGVLAFTTQRILDFVLPYAGIEPLVFGYAALLLGVTVLAGAAGPAWESGRARELLVSGAAPVTVYGSPK